PALIDKNYLSKRAALIGEKTMGEAPAGTPPGMELAWNWGRDNAIETPSTSHLVVVGGHGAGLSMATTVEDAFGSRQ
ncbi:gamma-glutamyltransferase, partial [Achromobacter sp. GbtcB20]|uniref:gamma-glutamyltransferase n=1 Tax=Achromobacter sp. GbtcB20 TaxID=2824765 RepID=UPI001C2F7302